VRGKFINLVGAKFDRWVVVARSERRGPRGEIYWDCCCACGVERAVLGGELSFGRSHSCGCLMRERASIRFLKHGHARRGKMSRTYWIWMAMRARCNNPGHSSYVYYGARGIRVCPRWDSFANFLTDMGEPPDGMSLDRIDNDKGYQPGNVRWATPLQQVRNRRPRKRKYRRAKLEDIQTYAAALKRAATPRVEMSQGGAS
jgi:hypothetical protein